MKVAVGIAALGVLVLAGTGQAWALSISNIDTKAHKVTVTAGGDSKELTIEAAKEADAPCDSGCKVKLENGEVYDLDGNEKVSIEDGVIFIDQAPAVAASDIPDIDPDAVPAPQ
jgi:hypothetical protein